MARTPKVTKEEVIEALKASGGDLTRAAVQLRVSPSTVYRAMERHGIEVRQTREIVTA